MPRIESLVQRDKRDLRIKRLLLEGLPVAQVATHLNLSRKFVHEFANEMNLPTNPTVREGSPMENDIFTASHCVPMDQLSKAYNIAPPMLKKIIARARKKWTAHVKELAA